MKKDNFEPEKIPRKASNNFKATNAEMLKEFNESYKSDDFDKQLTSEQKMTGFLICCD
jgi:hypothetical protein